MFGGGNKVKLDPDLLKRIRRVTEAAGYSSVDEFVTHALEKELAQLEEAESEEDLKNKLRGLGYIS